MPPRRRKRALAPRSSRSAPGLNVDSPHDTDPTRTWLACHAGVTRRLCFTVDLQPPPSSRATLSSMERVRASLVAQGLDHLTVREFAASTATASDAAAAIGTTVGRIVKSLVFMAGEQPVLVLVSGSNRVDVEKVGRLLRKPITRPNADLVKTLTGFSIGGVPPLGHAHRLATLIDRRSEEHTSELQSHHDLVCRLLLEK